MIEVVPKFENWERGEPDGFNRWIETLMFRMISQPQTEGEWD